MLRGGAYRILEPLGRGGMGALYLAADTGAFDRKCVVKELLDYYNPSDEEEEAKAQARFETEARLLAELSHPGIPRIYSYFSEGGRHYIVMEYIEGETLERAVTHVDLLGHTVPARPLAPEAVVRHAVRICQVLEYLAEQPTPVIHHDIKPANLIVDRVGGEVRLVDFGTAQARLQWATRGPAGTRGTTLFGTPGYAAPEQHQGTSEPRSDVYALAATIYHLLTDDDPAEHPFHFPKMQELPGPLGRALERALLPRVERRSTATELRQALEAWLVPEDGAQPFVFRSGAVAHTTADLVPLSDQHWRDARQHLATGDFARWFRSRNRHDLVAKVETAQLESNVDAALESFLHRLDPRLEVPRLTIEPLSLDFGRVARDGATSKTLIVRNEGRGYARANLRVSVPWLSIEPEEVGCLTGAEATVTVSIQGQQLPMQRDLQTVLACTPSRGSRISIPVSAELNVAVEWLRRIGRGLWRGAKTAGRGARRGLGQWTKTFSSLLRSQVGRWILLGEVLILAGVLVALWWTWRSWPLDLMELVAAYFKALPLSLLAVYLLPALIFAGVGAAWAIVKGTRRKP